MILLDIISRPPQLNIPPFLFFSFHHEIHFCSFLHIHVRDFPPVIFSQALSFYHRWRRSGCMRAKNEPTVEHLAVAAHFFLK